ncbi:MAG TPA: DUF1330 domain-containing protein [Candidatus Binatia bacterium]|jgi:uncharacterized protein (DUF1330 family)
MAIYPTPEQIQTLLAGPPDRPVVMLNLLRFKPQADGIDAGKTGEEAYRRYVDAMRTIIEAAGCRILWTGRVDSVVIGDEQAACDMIALVEYPSRQKFVEIALSDAVREIGVHRAAGLESQWLIATTEER